MPQIDEMPHIKEKLQERIKTVPLMGEIAQNMAVLYEMDKNNSPSWAASPIVGPEVACTDKLLLDYLLDLRNPYPPDRRENPITNP
jgi:hypothetical protein